MSGERLNPDSADVKPGEVLALAREEAGITQREVSDALHLPINTVAAIESGDRDQLPAHVFTRGYVRAYAKLMELDPDPLVAALSVDQQVEGGLDTSEQTSRGISTATSMAGIDLAVLKHPYVLLGAGAIIVVGILSWVLSGNGDSENSLSEPALAAPKSDSNAAALTSAQVPVEQQQDQEPTKVAEPLAAESESDSGTLTAIPVELVEDVQVEEVPVEDRPAEDRSAEESPAVKSPAAQSPVVANTVTVSDGLTATATGTTPGSQPQRLTPTGDDRLTIEFSEECWVEIKDPAGVALFGDLGQAGERIELVGAAPFRVLLGYAPGVRLTYNAEPVALTPHTRNNVASLVLGQ
jgi:cytoskeleton protein RodZ